MCTVEERVDTGDVLCKTGVCTGAFATGVLSMNTADVGFVGVHTGGPGWAHMLIHKDRWSEWKWH